LSASGDPASRIVLPAEPADGALIEALGQDVEAVAKDLEVYAKPQPAQDYSVEVEIEGVLREAAAQDWARFHLVGYSGGGAASPALAAAGPERLASRSERILAIQDNSGAAPNGHSPPG
jgi:pimeloyl-ACP methyl ester carboxylesterase